MTVTQTIVSGVAVILIAGLVMGSADVYTQVLANTEHRVSAAEKLDKALDSLARIEERQRLFEKMLDE